MNFKVNSRLLKDSADTPSSICTDNLLCVKFGHLNIDHNVYNFI